MNLIETAIARGQTGLSEFESKKLLNTFGIPVTREILADSADKAREAAEQIGYPVVLKACSWELMHKSEAGCIELNLTHPDAVQQAFEKISKSTDIVLEGILVQEMVPGQRELVVGMTRDPQFGPCVMLGYGGVMTEVIQDTVFRAAPFDKVEALDMTDELKSKEMFKAFRGQKPADMDAICRTLTAVGELSLQEKAITEIDINPLIISPDGSIRSVDALIIF